MNSDFVGALAVMKYLYGVPKSLNSRKFRRVGPDGNPKDASTITVPGQSVVSWMMSEPHEPGDTESILCKWSSQRRTTDAEGKYCLHVVSVCRHRWWLQ